jgi:hypothetical protein
MYSVIFVSSFIALAMNLIKIEPKISPEKSRLLERQNLSSRLELWPGLPYSIRQAGQTSMHVSNWRWQPRRQEVVVQPLMHVA